MRTIFLAALGLTLLPLRAHAECKNAYFPSTLGSTWEQKGDDGKITTMKVVKVDGSNITLEMSMAASDDGKPNTVTTGVSCSADGLKMDFSAMSFNFGGKGGKSSVKSVADSGVSFPPADKIKTGYSWTESHTMEMSGGASSPSPSAPSMKMTMKVDTVHTIVGSEKVKVEAGTFDAIKISDDITSSMSMAGAGMPAGMGSQPPSKSTSTTWIAKGVGIVKTERENPMGGGADKKAATTELVKYSIK